MRQALHIFRKDIRHYWPEWLVSLALLAGYARHEVFSWRSGEGAIAYGGWFFSFEFLSSLTVVLLPISWMLLIFRAVQGESLVGDRQFWITRPYEWSKLLAAKVLFVLITVNLPLLILDCFLLHRAGFAVAPYLGGLLWMQLLMAVFLLLPLVTLATVTANLAQTGLGILLVLLYLIGVAYISSEIPSSSFGWWTESVQFVLYVVACVMVILLQYARRRTTVSRGLILALGTVILLFVVLTPYARLVASRYPQLGPGEQPPAQLTLLPPPQPKELAGSGDLKEISLQLPLSISLTREDSIVVVTGQRIDVADGGVTRWNSGWTSQGLLLFPGVKQTQLGFRIKRRVFEQMSSVPVTIRVSLAMTVYRDDTGRELVTPAGDFVLPEVGLCTTGPPLFVRRIHCLAPLRRPLLLLISADTSRTTCEPTEEEFRAPQPENAYQFLQGSDEPAEFGISSVKIVDLSLQYANQPRVRPFRVTGICPGTPIRLSRPELVRRARMELVFSGIRLPDYQLR